MSRSNASRRRGLVAELLERRALLAGGPYATLSFGTLTIFGGAGNSADLIVLDADTPGENLLVEVDAGDDPGPLWTASFDVDDVFDIVMTGGGGPDILRLERDAGIDVTLDGGAGDDFIDLSYERRHLDNLTSEAQVEGGTGLDHLAIYDNNNSFFDEYNVSAADFARTAWPGVTYSGDIEELFLSTGLADNTVNVRSTGPQQELIIDSAGGHERVNIGHELGGLDVINGDVTIENFSGSTTLNISDVGGSEHHSYTLDAVGFASGHDVLELDPTVSIAYRALVTDAATLWLAEGNNTVRLREVLRPLSVIGNSGSDTFEVASDDNSVEFALAWPVTLVGNDGNDTLHLDNSGDTDEGGFQVLGSTIRHSLMGDVSYAGIELLRIHGGFGIPDITARHSFRGTPSNTALELFAGDGRDLIGASANPLPLHVYPSLGFDIIESPEQLAGNSGRVILEGSMTLSQLVAADGGRISIAGTNQVVTVYDMFLSMGGLIDVGTNAMIVDYSGEFPPPVRDYLVLARNGGTWNGSGGITSSAAAAAPSTRAVGYAEASSLFSTFPATWLGQQVDNTSILIRQTRLGDANLDGSVNLADFNRLAGNFGLSGKLWIDGDFNYNDSVNLGDFNALAGNFGGVAPSAPRAGRSAVEVEELLRLSAV